MNFSERPLAGSVPPPTTKARPLIYGGTPRRAARTAIWDLRGFKPFPWQTVPLVEIESPPGKQDPRFFQVNVGRGAGKTTLAPELVWEGALNTEVMSDGLGPAHVKIFADTYEHGQLIWDVVWADAATIMAPFVHSMDADRRLITLHYPGDSQRPGASIQLLSSDNERMLTGHNKTTLAVVDESQFVKNSAWRQFYPCLNIRRGVAVCFGVCQGAGWYKTNSLRGFDTDDWPEYKTWRFPSTENPYFGQEEDELAAREYTPEEYAQLFLAMWRTAEGAVFENIANCIMDPQRPIALPNGKLVVVNEPIPGHDYIAGLDIAKQRDFMALLIGDRGTGRVVAAMRANKRTYTFLEGLVADALMIYNPRTWVDTTSMGESVYDHIRSNLRDRYNDMEPPPDRRARFVPEELQLKRRQELIDDLALSLIQERTRFPNFKQLVNELENFEKTVLPSGVIRMAAPEGLHDDLVIALALMNQGVPKLALRSQIMARVNQHSKGWQKVGR